MRHNLLDFGSSLGSGALAPAEYWEGHEYLVQIKGMGRQMVSLGLAHPAWHTTPYYEARSIGRLPLNNTSFDPDAWRPRVQNQAFLHTREDDKFWAAQKLIALRTDLLKAAVRAGDFGDPASETFLVRALAERRDAIARAYLTALNPISDPVLEADGTLSFRNAAVDADVAHAPEGYRAIWSVFDNTTGELTRITETTSRTTVMRVADLPAAPGVYVNVALSAVGGTPPSWQEPVHVYFRNTGSGWRLVGFERTPNRSEAVLN